MRSITSYFLGFIGALGFTLGTIGAYNPRYSFTERLFGGAFVNNNARVISNHKNDYEFNGLDNNSLSFLIRSITRETIKELSDLVKTNTEETAEVGGELRLYNRVIFYEAPNENLKTISELENKDLYDPITLAYMTGFLDARFSGINQCAPGNSDVNWQYRIKKTREAIEAAQKNIGDPVMALNYLIENLRDTYVKGDVIGYPYGLFLGELHTHNNATRFSDVDLCVSHSRTLFLVSHNYPTSNVFNLYIAKDGKTVDLGEYDIE